MKMPKYPHIKVKLTGINGNAWNLLGVMSKAMKKAELPKEEISAFTDEATSGNYDKLLQTCMEWVDVQ
jgi:hypothetical protein